MRSELQQMKKSWRTQRRQRVQVQGEALWIAGRRLLWTAAAACAMRPPLLSSLPLCAPVPLLRATKAHRIVCARRPVDRGGRDPNRGARRAPAPDRRRGCDRDGPIAAARRGGCGCDCCGCACCDDDRRAIGSAPGIDCGCCDGRCCCWPAARGGCCCVLARPAGRSDLGCDCEGDDRSETTTTRRKGRGTTSRGAAKGLKQKAAATGGGSAAATQRVWIEAQKEREMLFSLIDQGSAAL